MGCVSSNDAPSASKTEKDGASSLTAATKHEVVENESNNDVKKEEEEEESSREKEEEHLERIGEEVGNEEEEVVPQVQATSNTNSLSGTGDGAVHNPFVAPSDLPVPKVSNRGRISNIAAGPINWSSSSKVKLYQSFLEMKARSREMQERGQLPEPDWSLVSEKLKQKQRALIERQRQQCTTGQNGRCFFNNSGGGSLSKTEGEEEGERRGGAASAGSHLFYRGQRIALPTFAPSALMRKYFCTTQKEMGKLV